MPNTDFSQITIGGVPITVTDDIARASITSLEQSKGAASGIASLDTNGKLVAAQKPQYSYSDINYTIENESDNNSYVGVVQIDGTKPINIIPLEGNVTSVSFAAEKLPEIGHICHVIFTSTQEVTVSISHTTTGLVRYICPGGMSPADLVIPEDGYVEISFLRGNDTTENESTIAWIYVRGI